MKQILMLALLVTTVALETANADCSWYQPAATKTYTSGGYFYLRSTSYTASNGDIVSETVTVQSAAHPNYLRYLNNHFSSTNWNRVDCPERITRVTAINGVPDTMSVIQKTTGSVCSTTNSRGTLYMVPYTKTVSYAFCF